jgi:hypothetical protein
MKRETKLKLAGMWARNNKVILLVLFWAAYLMIKPDGIYRDFLLYLALILTIKR